MKDRIYLDRSKRFYKGNLHTHTVWSDGRITAEEVVELFKKKGYHFISISDHEIYCRTEEFNTDHFITIPGMERAGLKPFLNHNPTHHLGVIDDPTVAAQGDRYSHLQRFPVPLPWEGDHSVQDLIDELRLNGNLVIYNHPEWSLAQFDTMVKYDGLLAVEIYNHSTEWTPATSYGTAYWDYALQQGKRIYATASDDSHYHVEEWKIPEYGGGWVQIQTEALTHLDLVKGLKAGSYYSSSGPEIYDLRVENGKLYIECSPCKYIMFKSFPQRAPFLGNFETGEPLTGAHATIREEMHYIRIECIDFQGNVAWTNPVFVADLNRQESATT